jgi:predicted ATPase/energy-coupling factor transporter ATP-binding protein EcfA2
MRLVSARIQKYRSIRDTGWFDVEHGKTILVGSNEAGKTALLQALQQINPPEGIAGFVPLRDYPRSEYNDITTGKVEPADVKTVAAKFALDEDDLASLPNGYKDAVYVRTTALDNHRTYYLDGGPPQLKWDTELQKDFQRMASHLDKQAADGAELPSTALAAATKQWRTGMPVRTAHARALRGWLDANVSLVDESNSTEDNRHTRLIEQSDTPGEREAALSTLNDRLPTFVLFNNYFRVRPSIHLDHLAQRLKTGILDDAQYDYGNECLLKLLGFSADELSALGRANDPHREDAAALQAYKDQLDQRRYQLNAASVRLTEEITRVWNPKVENDEANRLRVAADGQYLKVSVEDDLGVEVELDQRSEGFQWLVSFFVVFFAEAIGKHENAILLLDEPGLSLHALKQRDFRATISRLAERNQTLYTTHSPFLVGPSELDLVRVVEMTDRTAGTNVHTTVSAQDPASLLPLQEALGYDLAQSLFTQQRNLVLEGLTDYWYVEATSQLLGEAGNTPINDKIALIPAEGAGKVVYYATILHANNLKVAALLDSDAAGDAAAEQETLVHQLGNKNILRTTDAYNGPVKRPEIEELLRDTLIDVAKADLGWDVAKVAAEQPARPLVDVFAAAIKGFSKYKLAKAYVRWTRDHDASELTADERASWKVLIDRINKAVR